MTTQEMLPVMRKISRDIFIFQQDSAPAHGARETVALLQREVPAFIAPDLWPPNSHDLNPVDYKVWGTMQDRVYQTKVRDIDDLKRRLFDVWDNLEQSVIDDAIDQWRPRLRACVRAKGGILNILYNLQLQKQKIVIEFGYKLTFYCSLRLSCIVNMKISL